MKAPVAPRLEKRRSADFLAELRERARAWIPEWDLSAGQGDFGQALLEVAARFSSEISERLDQAGDKMRGGFLDWLGMRGKAARPARVPVVFRLNDSAQAPVEGIAPLRLQANAGAVPVVFETEKSVTIIPAKLQMIVAADPDNDAYYLPPPDLTSLAPIEQEPVNWTVKSFASAGATALQLMPGVGLLAGMLIKLNGRQYAIKTADKDLITIDRPLEAAANKDTEVDKVASFAPFGSAAANQQKHVLYIGDTDLLNIDAAAIIGVQNAAGLRSGVKWQYLAKLDESDPDWKDLRPSAAQDQPGVLLLEKPPGSMAQQEIAGHNARWIRAYADTVHAAQSPFETTHLAIKINPSAECKPGQCPPPDGTASIQADAMANTTPLVLDNLFYPLGKEPHQFDAFYLGSTEAFSKAGARVQLCFEMADQTFDSLSAVRSPVFGLNPVLVGVGHDRALHLLQLDPGTGKVNRLRGRPPLYPASPGYSVGQQPGSAISLDKNALWRPPAWSVNSAQIVFATAVCAGSTVWVWQEHPLTVASGWVKFGDIPSTSTSAPNIQSLIALNEVPGAIMLFALRESTLYGRVWPQTAVDWAKIPTTINLVSIVAVRKFDATFAGIGTAGMVGIDDQGDLYQVSATGVCTQLLSTLPAVTFNKTVLPAAVEIAGTLMVAAVIDDPSDIKLTVIGGLTEVQAPVISSRKALRALEPVLDGGEFHVLLTSTDGNTQSLHDWVPFDASWATLNDLFTVSIDAGTTNAGPTEIDGTVVVPGNHADVLSASYDATKRFQSMGQIDAGIVVSDALSFLTTGDFITRVDSMSVVQSQPINSVGVTKDGETLYEIAGGFPAGSTRLDAFPQSKSFPGSSVGANQWQLDLQDHTTVVGGYIQIGIAADFYHVDAVNATTHQATLTPALSAGATIATSYVPGWITNGRMAPVMNSVPGSWTADALDRPIGFPTLDPTAQSAKAFAVDASNHPTLLALGREFDNTVANPFTYGNPYRFVIEAAVGKWNRDASGDSNNNPELSWEYWNGKGWLRLNLDRDDTLNLQITGPVQFTVPTDIAPSDWAGKTNPWIRARLIGGDYGREKFITSGPTTTRSTDDIHPPSALKLTISYQLCKAVLPAFVLTYDSGSLVDQSNANRSTTAKLEAFVPLAVTLGRLLQPGAPSVAGAPADPSSAPCHCPGGATTVQAPPPATTAPSATSSSPSGASHTGPCLFVGIDGTVAGSDVHVLVLTAAEHNYTPFAPLEVQAIVANRFTPIVASDGTRALGESGLIEMSFAVPPSKTDLFGQPLVWLRLLPRGGATTQIWQPAIGGIYLNAVYAKSTETLTRELLGSADGSPNLTVTLARPPVLDGTLELRVREPLGDQELKDLKDRGLVVTEGSDCWVLWKQVDDTADQPAGERVYSLDESIGKIRFGDGLHGMIPPIGRDSIVAFSYQRTEPPAPGSDVVPANGIPARTPLNLVSPVETVESVTTAADSAGGSAPETTDTVLQFGYARLRHRDRALTLEDFEDLALESSPSIAQARASQLSRGRVQVIVVMRGDPLPTLSQIRELRRNLLSQAPAALALPEALKVSGPTLRELRIQLSLDVESLDKAAEVSVEVKARVKALFDTVAGNLSRDGWPLGLTPSEDVVASAISNVPGLASTTDIKFFEIDAKGNELPWPTQIKATELVVPANDAVRLEFHSLEVVA